MNDKDIKEKEKEAEIGRERERESGKEWPLGKYKYVTKPTLLL